MEASESKAYPLIVLDLLNLQDASKQILARFRTYLRWLTDAEFGVLYLASGASHYADAADSD